MEEIKFYKRPKLKNPALVVAWPGMGEVAYKSALSLVEKLHAEEFAQIRPKEFFYLTGSVIEKGILTVPRLPSGKFYYWKRPAAKKEEGAAAAQGKLSACDLIFFVSDSQPDLSKAQAYSSAIIQLAKSLKVKKIIAFAAMPQPIDHTQEPKVWLAATSKELVNSLRALNFNLLSQGQISGMNGLFLGLAKKEGLDGFCLLGDIPLYTIQIENPRAALAVCRAFARVFGLSADFPELKEQSQLMEQEISKLMEYLKIGTPDSPIGEEEIEKIKKTLGQLTKLPLSVKEKIEKLFLQAGTDISKANELKNELDKWNVYKDYEDRFLDLFRRKKDKDN